MTIKEIQFWRRFVGLIEAALIIALPFIRIRGENVLRFDVSTLRLHLFGMNIWMEEFYILLIAIIFISMLFILTTVVFGRIWCGWLCPQTVLSDLTTSIKRKHTLYSFPLLLPISIIVSANLIWYFISPYEFFPSLIKGELGKTAWISWIVLTIIMLLNLSILRYKFCATICPYGRLQGTLFDHRTLVVAFDNRRNKECMNCRACVKICPVNIDIRKGPASECIVCARCVDECSKLMGIKHKKSLINYSFGIPGEKGRFMRPNVILIGVITLLFLVYLIHLLLTRLPVEITILPNPSFQLKVVEKAKVNSYILSIRNKGRKDMEFMIRAASIDGKIKMRPEGTINVKAGEIKRIPIYIMLKDPLQGTTNVEIYLKSKRHPEIEVSRRIKI